MECLWAGWRIPAMQADRSSAGDTDTRTRAQAETEADRSSAGDTVSDRATVDSAGADHRATVESTAPAITECSPGRTLFEAILDSGLPDEQSHIIWRGSLVYALLNRYPYSTGHLLVVPRRAIADLEDLDTAERLALWDAVHAAVIAVKAAFSPDGVNIGANIGSGAGPSVPDHLHVHVVPRWDSDTNFMTAIADVRVLPQTLQDTWEQLRAAWPRTAAR